MASFLRNCAVIECVTKDISYRPITMAPRDERWCFLIGGNRVRLNVRAADFQKCIPKPEQLTFV